MVKKTAVILLNLGGPDSLKNVKPFLFNLFNDKAIISLPNPFRWLIAKLISSRREKTAQEIYSHMGGKSPILEETKNQAKLLEKSLNAGSNKFKVFIAMRYWKPFVDEAIQEISKNKGQFSEVILLPLYPQFSTTTSESSIKEYIEKSSSLNLPVKSICCFFKDKKFINTHVKSIKELLKNNKISKSRILFSAHGLPESVIKKGDPYQWQVEQTVKAISDNLDLKKHKVTICYQSRVGPMKWIGPSTEDEIVKGAKDGETLVVVPIAFVSEHSETLVELDIEYKELFEKNGGKKYYRVPALSSDKNFIECLSSLVKKVGIEDLTDKSIISSEFKKLCPKEFCRCVNNYE